MNKPSSNGNNGILDLSGNAILMFLIGFLYIHFALDFINKLNIFGIYETIKFTRFLKLFTVITSIVLIPFLYSRISKVYNISLIIFLVFLLSLLIRGNLYLNQIESFSRYTFGVLFLPVIYYALFGSVNPEKYVLKFFKIIIIINTICIIAGLVWEVKFFSTYGPSRFGYNGLLVSQGNSPYFYLSCYFLFFYYKEYLFLFVSILASLMGGMKAIYLAIFIFFALNIIRANYSKRKVLLFSLTLIVGLIVILFVQLNSDLFTMVIQNKGLFSALFSLRDVYTTAIFNSMNSNNFSWLLGNIALPSHRAELEIIDSFLFFGIIGVLLHFALFSWLLYAFKNYRTLNNIVITIFIVSALIGNFFYIPMSFTYVSVVYLLILRDQKEDEKTGGNLSIG